MRTLLLFLMGTILLLGCSAEKRLGESRIEARRYSRGFHVQHHRSHHTPFQHKAETRSLRSERTASATHDVKEGMASQWDSPELTLARLHSGEGEVRMNSLSPLRRLPRRTQSEVPQTKQPVLLETEALPEPIEGYHPNAVPGFILSLGWALGIMGEFAVQYLQMPLSGVAIALGILASIAGYVLSRKAYRASLAHPELYPRYRLPRAARFVSIGFLAPIALYVALVLLVFLFVGGFGLL